MPRRLALMLSGPIAGAIVALAGCSAGSSPVSGPAASSPVSTATGTYATGAAPGTDASTPGEPASSAPASPVAAGTTPVAGQSSGPSAAPAPAPVPTLVRITAGNSQMFSGSGCGPNAAVTVIGAASGASGRTLGHGTANASGQFSVTVTVPDLGQPKATLSVRCAGPGGNTITAEQMTIEYVSPPTTVRLAAGSSYTVTGGGCGSGSAVSVILGTPHGTGTTIGQGTADASGKFSVPVTVPYLAQPTATITAACANNPTAAVILIEYTQGG